MHSAGKMTPKRTQAKLLHNFEELHRQLVPALLQGQAEDNLEMLTAYIIYP